jgi:transposase
MSQEIRAKYDQVYMLPPSLEEWIGEDHPARFIRAFVDELDLKRLGFKERKSEDGRPSYAPDLLLKAWLYGYLQRIYSTRSLERACREHMSLIWLTGMHPPDHNTLWRFWRDNKEPLRRVFSQAIKIALSWDMIGLVLHAIDGTKIRADVSKKGAWHREDLVKLDKCLKEALDEAEKQVEASEREEVGDYRLPEDLQGGESLSEAIHNAIEEMDGKEQKHLHPSDMDARMMLCEERKVFAYNAQVVADEASGLIVAQDVFNDQSDAHLLTPMLDEVKQTLGQTADHTVADGGYLSGQELRKAEKAGYEVIVNLGQWVNPTKKRKDYHSANFTYDAARDICICPQGEELRFERNKWSRGGYLVGVYRCHRGRECPVKHLCTRDPRARMIEVAPYHQALARQREKQKDDQSRYLLKKRMEIVEVVFARVKQRMGFRRWTFRTLANIRAQWTLLCTAHNLSKMYQVWLRQRHYQATAGQSKSNCLSALCLTEARLHLNPPWAF